MSREIDGLPVIDAKRPITLHITEGDCSKANPKKPETCAAAQCIKREIGAVECRVHLGRVYIRQNKGNWQRYFTPPALRTEIISFDRGGAFAPGDYKLLPPTKPANGKAQGTKTGKNKKHGKKRRSYHVVTNVRNGPAA